MMQSRRTLLATLASIGLTAMAIPAQSDDLLASARDNQRPVLLFGNADDSRVQQQFQQFTQNAPATRDRDIAVYLVSRPAVLPQLPQPGAHFATAPQKASLEHRFHVQPDTFTLILIGKDGGEKFRSTRVIPFATLAAVIDAMPMRQQEMHTR